MLIRSADNRGLVNFHVSKKQFTEDSDSTKVTFHRYGNAYFLKQVQYNYDNLGFELPRSRAEREMIKKVSDKRDDITSAESGTFEVIVINGQ